MNLQFSDPKISTLIQKLSQLSKEIIADNFFGMYIFGSLASGDFNPQTSDIDFVVIIKNDLDSKVKEQLTQRIKQEILPLPLSEKLEGSYLPLRVFVEKNQKPAMYLSINTGKEVGDDHKGIEQPVQRFMIREDGIVIDGPDTKSFLSPIAKEELVSAVSFILHDWWKPQLLDDHRLVDREYQSYAVLTMCRMLVTIEDGIIISKPQAAQKIQSKYPQWADLISRAVEWKHDDFVNDLEPTKALIEFVLDQSTTNL